MFPLAAALGACVDHRAGGHVVGADLRAMHVVEELEGPPYKGIYRGPI